MFATLTSVGSDYIIDTFTITATSAGTAQEISFAKNVRSFVMVIDEDVELRIVRSTSDTDYFPIKGLSTFYGNFQAGGGLIGYAYVPSGTATVHVLAAF